MRDSKGKFVKGGTGFTGKHSEETKRKISLANKGQQSWLGRKHTEESKKKISEVQKGRHLKHDKQFKKGQTPWNKGTGTKSTENQLIRASVEYKLWRTSVFTRDGYKCIWCQSTKLIQADHIKQFAYYPELRFAIDNGRTLCRSCHQKTDTWGKNYKIN